jgi:HAD superfamily hydrolase (TIGR01484 family)
MQKGTIALDIDGTITDATHKLPDEVALFFLSLYKEGWQFIFMTGREFVYAMDALSKLDFPFYLAVQNGADLIKMPEHEHLASFYLDAEIVTEVEKFFEGKKGDFLLYAGYEKGDFCYYRPHRFPPEMKEYLQSMQRRSALPWKAVEHFTIRSQNSFSMIKAIGYEHDFLDIEAKFLVDHSAHCVTIRDPKTDHYYYLLITHCKASKREALHYFLSKHSMPKPLIVAGDDYNDREALELGDVRVVMETAPSSLKKLADIIAPSSAQKGIINGVNAALDRCRKSGCNQQWA